MRWLAAALVALCLGGCGPVTSRAALRDARALVAAARQAPPEDVDVYALTRAEVYLAEARERLAHADHGDARRYAEAASRWATRALPAGAGEVNR